MKWLFGTLLLLCATAYAQTTFSISRTSSGQTPTPFTKADRICCGGSTNWPGIETSRGTYVWTGVDGFVSSDASHPGSFPIYTDRYVPTWANGTGGQTTAPTDLLSSTACQGVLSGITTTDCMYKEFMTAFMRHVCGVSAAPVSPLVGVCTVKVFEAWNEWNVGNYWTDTYPKLAQMLEDKAAIIRLYCGDCTVIGGSVSAGGDGSGGSWITSLESVLQSWAGLGTNITPIVTLTLTSNNNSTGIVATPARKQLANVGTGCSVSHVIQPTGVPVGQLYATAAIASAAITAGCTSQGSVTATASGVGIANVDNGQNAGGTDSPSAITDTYGGTADDSVCTGDPNNALPTIQVGLAPLGCVTASSAVFGVTTAIGFPFADVLWPSDYPSNSTVLDTALNYIHDTYFEVPDVTKIHNLEMDVNINSSPTAYAANHGAYFGWGFQYNGAAHSFQYCQQNCPAWRDLRGIDITGGNPDLTTYTLISAHWYRIRMYGHRDAGCTFASGANCAFYDYMTLYDVTAASTPITYRLVDAVSGSAVGFIPVDHASWAAGPDTQIQIDMTTANITGTVHIVSDTTQWYSGVGTAAHLPNAISWHAYPSRLTIKPVPMPETLLALGSGTCTGTSNSSCRTAIKDQVSTLYSSSILRNLSIIAWAANLPVWQTEGGYGINSGVTDGVSDTDANTKFLRAAYTARWMAILASRPSSGNPPVHVLEYSYQDQCWGTNNGTNVSDGNCMPPDSLIPVGATSVNAAFIRMQGWLATSSSIGPLVGTAVAGGNVYTINMTVGGTTNQLAWFDGNLATSDFTTTYGTQQTLDGTISSVVANTVTLSNQPMLLSNPVAPPGNDTSCWPKCAR